MIEAPNHPPQPASFFRVVGAVLSAFVGIRKRGSAGQQFVVKPAHLVAATVICALVFIATLIAIVRFVIAK